MPNSGQFGQPGRSVYISPGRPAKERYISTALDKSFRRARGDVSRMEVIADRIAQALETGWLLYDRPEGVSFGDLLESYENEDKKKSKMATRIQIVDADTYAVFMGPDIWLDLFKFVTNHTDGPVRVEEDKHEGIQVIWNMPLEQIPSELMEQLPQSDPLSMLPAPSEETLPQKP